MDAAFHVLAQQAGIHFMGQSNLQWQKKDPYGNGLTVQAAMDAQPGLVTYSNSGPPAFLTTYIDPGVIEVLVAPMRAAEIVGDEVKKGDWTTTTAMFPIVESAGEVSSYGDYNENGLSTANINYPQRQSYHYQTMTQYGELELERAGLGRVDWANRLMISSVLNLNKYQNLSYFFGVAGLENYGLLNDPSLPAAITPGLKASGGVAWSAASTAIEVYADIQTLVQQLIVQSQGLIDLDTPMTLAMAPLSTVALTKTTTFNVNVEDILRKNFPKLTIKSAPEYATASGNLVQLIANEIQGQRTASCAFTEKLRAHPIVVRTSSFVQKKSQGTWGTIIFRPIFIAQMIGV